MQRAGQARDVRAESADGSAGIAMGLPGDQQEKKARNGIADPGQMLQVFISGRRRMKNHPMQLWTCTQWRSVRYHT
jgi:hypothetical protein